MHTTLTCGATASRRATPCITHRLLPLIVLASFGTPADAADFSLPDAADSREIKSVRRERSANADDGITLPAIEVQGTLAFPEKNLLPGTRAAITSAQASASINTMDVEDMLKYLPDILVRKRYIGDTQAPMATRTTGINASARSLIYADGVLLSTLINNNNGNGSPQWFMVTPQDVERIDVMYGPFAAQFPGNSYGAVTEITTRMPMQFEASADVTASSQHFSKYASSTDAAAQQYSATLGDRVGPWSWRFSASHLESTSQPITFATIGQSSSVAAGGLPLISGAIADSNRSGGAIQVIGAGNFVRTVQDNAAFKVAYDFTPTLRAAYTLGYWQNDAQAYAVSYLTTTSGAPYYGAGSGSVNIGGYAYSASSVGAAFSSSKVQQEHLMQSLNVGTSTQGPFDWQLILSNVDYLQDLSRNSTGLYPVAANGGAGRMTDMGGTGWSTLDWKGVLRPQESGANTVSFGVHYDQFKLLSPTYNTADWISGSAATLYSNSVGKTQTAALWLQDVWRIAPALTATLGGRYESWRAYDGYNFATGSGGTLSVYQPGMDKSGFSPKAALAWALDGQWLATASFGKALRFPTVGELYQSVQTGSVYTQANPFLQPESVLSGELALERFIHDGKLRVSLFNEYVSNALISQTSTIPGYVSPVSYTQNVDRTRQTGIELAAQQDNVLIKGWSLSGNLTYVDARILADSGYVATIPGATAIGKRVPYVPTWRATLASTYRPDAAWAYTLAARYSGRVYATVDNTDIYPNTYQGFDAFFVVDARVQHKFDRHWSGALGVDNLNNRQYFLFHPFPQRTVYAQLKYDY